MDNILLRMKSEEWNQVMNVNLNGPFHLTKTVLKDMVRTRMEELLIFLLFQEQTVIKDKEIMLHQKVACWH